MERINNSLINANIKLVDENKELKKEIELRKEEWDNCQDRENIKSHHYIMLIRDLLELIGSDKE